MKQFFESEGGII